MHIRRVICPMSNTHCRTIVNKQIVCGHLGHFGHLGQGESFEVFHDESSSRMDQSTFWNVSLFVREHSFLLSLWRFQKDCHRFGVHSDCLGPFVKLVTRYNIRVRFWQGSGAYVPTMEANLAIGGLPTRRHRPPRPTPIGSITWHVSYPQATEYTVILLLRLCIYFYCWLVRNSDCIVRAPKTWEYEYGAYPLGTEATEFQTLDSGSLPGKGR